MAKLWKVPHCLTSPPPARVLPVLHRAADFPHRVIGGRSIRQTRASASGRPYPLAARFLGLLLAQPTPSPEDRSLALTARSWARSRRAGRGRLDPFAKPSGNGRYLRSPDGRCRREADIADRVLGRLNWAESRPTGVAQGTAGIGRRPGIGL